MTDTPESNPSRRETTRLGLLIAGLVLAAGVFVVAKSRRDEPAVDGGGAGAAVQAAARVHPLDWKDLPDRVEPTRAALQDDPTQDGWDTEHLQKQAHRQIDTVLHWLTHPGELKTQNAAPVVADAFTCGALRPKDLTTVYSSRLIEVRRPSAKDDRVFRGAAGLIESLRELVATGSGELSWRVEVHVVRIELDDKSFTTEQLVTLAAMDGSREINTTWSSRWTLPGSDALPRLLTLNAIQFEQSQTTHEAGALFADCTIAAIGHNESFERQIMHGANHWARLIEYPLGTDMLGLSAMALGDVNGDDLDDVYLTQSGGLPNKLFVQQPDGTFDDRSADAGVDWLERAVGAIFVDLDNDGDQDLVIACDRVLLFMSNDGAGKFKLEKRLVLGDSPNSVTAADYDNDGDLDVFAMVYYSPKDAIGEYPVAIPYHDASNGGRNIMLRNDGAWSFTDVTDEVGLDADNQRFSFTASWEDYDNDGDQDVYIANDFGRNSLYRNDGGRFVSVAAQAGVEDIAAGMSASWGDVNGDGLMDLYVGNMYSNAGNRVTYQRRFKPGVDEDALGQFRRHARGSTLFENLGDGTFADVSVEAGLTMGRWAWASALADFNNDGWDDALITNGNVTGVFADDL